MEGVPVTEIMKGFVGVVFEEAVICVIKLR